MNTTNINWERLLSEDLEELIKEKTKKNNEEINQSVSTIVNNKNKASSK